MYAPENANKPCARPQSCAIDNIAGLYRQFESLFLADGGVLISSCGHKVLVFDHHFFHLAALRSSTERMFMVDEKEEILRTVEGHGKYTLDHNGSRAGNLPSAKLAIMDPDEVWEGNPRAAAAKWVYVKEFDSKPYAYTVALLTDRPAEGGIIVPVSSFPCRKGDVRKWRAGELVYQKQIQPPLGG
jgi:phage-Barnase-EndoU-ColicinE5/D-RelE like nuclease2